MVTSLSWHAHEAADVFDFEELCVTWTVLGKICVNRNAGKRKRMRAHRHRSRRSLMRTNASRTCRDTAAYRVVFYGGDFSTRCCDLRRYRRTGKTASTERPSESAGKAQSMTFWVVGR